MSVFLPYVYKNVSDVRIARAFDVLAKVDHIDRVSKTDKNGKQYDSVYVHFSQWFDAPEVERFQQAVINKKGRIVYDDPWFWQVFENTGTKREPVTEATTVPATVDAPAPQEQQQQQQQQQHPYEQMYYTDESYYMPPPYTLPQFPLPFMPPANEEQMLVHVDYVAKLEQEYARVVAENIWLKNLVAELDGEIDAAETEWTC